MAKKATAAAAANQVSAASTAAARRAAAEGAGGGSAAMTGPTAEGHGFTLDMAPADIKRRVAALKPQVTAAAGLFASFRAKAADLRGPLMDLFDDLVSAARKARLLFTRADFARCFDPSVPFHRTSTQSNATPGYQQNATYAAIDWIWRSANKKPSGKQGERNPATDQVGRLIRTFVPLLKDPTPLYKALAVVFDMQRKGADDLANRVEKCEPLIDIEKLPGVKVHLHKIDLSTADEVDAIAEPVIKSNTRGMSSGEREMANIERTLKIVKQSVTADMEQAGKRVKLGTGTQSGGAIQRQRRIA